MPRPAQFVEFLRDRPNRLLHADIRIELDRPRRPAHEPDGAGQLAVTLERFFEEGQEGVAREGRARPWPTKAPLGYVDNLATHRIEVDPVRGPLLTTLFDLYASGQYSLKALTAKAHEVGLTHTKETAVERTFVQFYPTLLEVARRKGTAKPGF